MTFKYDGEDQLCANFDRIIFTTEKTQRRFESFQQRAVRTSLEKHMGHFREAIGPEGGGGAIASRGVRTNICKETYSIL